MRPVEDEDVDWAEVEAVLADVKRARPTFYRLWRQRLLATVAELHKRRQRRLH